MIEESEKSDTSIKRGITCMLCIDNLEILAVGSNDTLIRLYENKIKTIDKNKIGEHIKHHNIKKTL